MQTEIVVAIIMVIPALLSPVIYLLIYRFGLGHESRELQLRAQTLEILERVLSLQNTLRERDDPYSEAVKKELEQVMGFVEGRSAAFAGAGETEPEKLSRIRRALLLFKPQSKKAWVLHILFYLFVYEMIFLFVFIPYQYLSDSRELEDPLLLIPSLLVFVILAYVFQRYAMRAAKRNAQN